VIAMTWMLALFYLFATITVLSGLGVISARNPVHAALFLVLTFVSASGLFVLLQAEFLAMALIVVYVGAVMVLFLFVVMMLDVNTDPLQEGFARYLPVGLLVAVVMAVELLSIVGMKYFGLEQHAMPAALSQTHSNTEQIGLLMFTTYAYPFEIASVVLLVAAIAAIALTLRKRTGVKVQDPAEQVKASKAGRLKIVSMPAVKTPSSEAQS
jgi:NADH-quinone oxidoreductase subunit J